MCTPPNKLCSWTMTRFGTEPKKHCANSSVMCTISNRLQLDNVQVYKERTCKEVGQLPGGACNTQQTLQLDNDREWEKGYKELCRLSGGVHNTHQTVQQDNDRVWEKGYKELCQLSGGVHNAQHPSDSAAGHCSSLFIRKEVCQLSSGVHNTQNFVQLDNFQV